MTQPEAVVKQLRDTITSGQKSVNTSVEGSTLNDIVLIRSFPLLAATEPDVMASVDRSGQNNLLGIRFLARFRVTLDLPHHRLILERATDYKDHLRRLGLRCVFIGPKKRVESVRQGSLAMQAGFRNDDLILAVDGRSCDGLTFLSIQKLLDGYEDTLAIVQVRHREGRRGSALRQAGQRADGHQQQPDGHGNADDQRVRNDSGDNDGSTMDGMIINRPFVFLIK